MKLYVNKYDLQDFYGRYGYDYHEAEGKGEAPFITDAEGNFIASAPHYDMPFFEGDGNEVNKLAENLKSQGILADVDESDAEPEQPQEAPAQEAPEQEEPEQDEQPDQEWTESTEKESEDDDQNC